MAGAKDLKVLKDVPPKIGQGEGGGMLPRLNDILIQIDTELNNIKTKQSDLEQRVSALESGGTA